MIARTAGDYEPVFSTIYQYWLARSLHAFIDLNMANLIGSKHVSASELSAALVHQFPAINENYIYRLLRALAIVGVLNEDAHARFSLTDIGKDLCNPAITDKIKQHFTQAHWETIAKLDKNSSTEQLTNLSTNSIASIPDKLNAILFNYRASKALYLFVQFNLAEHFTNRTTTLDELAKACGMDKAILQVICTLLSEQNILLAHEDHYELTHAGELLHSRNALSLKNVVLHENTRRWLAAANLARAITENKDAFTLTFNQDLFTLLAKLQGDDKVEFDIFNKAMSEISSVELYAIRHMNIQAEVNTVMDVGGGTGALMLSLLHEHQHLHGIIFDLPETINQVRLTEKRCRAVGGSFFEPSSIPKCDMVVMKRALHDWPNDKAIEILKNCSAKCQRLNIIEWLWRNTPFVASLDLGLMSIGGKIRSEQEFKDLFAAAEIEYTATEELGPGIFAVCGKPKPQLENQAHTSPRK